ncbi:hypothetical protein HKCCE2091_14865 [Rhodobacterales bacterium HKCCE2091]|nr:hypothetical protein [Rhodobacterales bacterium HKCCE2091]
MIASLPMYDRPECRDATDRLWGLIRDGLRERGIDAPDDLTRDRDLWDTWTDPALVFSQTCGLPLRDGLSGRVTYVASPDYHLPGCAPGEYNSVVVARGGAVPEHPRAAINQDHSQSGWGALWAWSRATGVTLGPVTATGAHAASARAVIDGDADLAAIDAHTLRLLQRHEDWARPLVEIDRTRPTPATPYITAAGCDPAPYRAALTAAVAALSEGDRQALDLHGVAVLPDGAYEALPIPPAP